MSSRISDRRLSRRQILIGGAQAAIGLGVLGLTACAPVAVRPVATPAPEEPAEGATQAPAQKVTNALGIVFPDDTAPLEYQIWPSIGTTNRPFIDPMKSNYNSGPGHFSQEKLFYVNMDYELTPGAAEKVDVSTDGLTWTYTIRPGLQWQDGSPLTAADYVYSIKRGADPKTAADLLVTLFAPIKNWAKVTTGELPLDDLGVKQIDDLHFSVTTEGPIPYLPLVLNYTTPVPQARVEKFGDEWAATVDNYLSSGPYMLTKWDRDKEVMYELNPNYKGPLKPYFAKVVFSETGATGSVQGGSVFPIYLNNEIYGAGSYWGGLTTSDIARAKEDPVLSKELWWYQDFMTIYLTMDTYKPPFDNVKVRKALALAVDRQVIVDQVLQGAGVVGTTMSPPGFHGYNPELANKYQYYDLEQAKKLLAEAGYPDGQGFPRTPLWTRGGEWANVAEAVSAMLKQNLNLDFPVEDRAQKVFMDALYAGEIPLALTRYQFDYVDASNMLGIWVNGRRHTWKNSKYDELISQADTETQDPNKRLQLYSDAETILLDEVASVFIAHPKFPELIKSFVSSPEFKPNKGGQEGYKALNDFTLINAYLTQEAVTRLGKPWPPSA